jgi:hypothetical protein
VEARRRPPGPLFALLAALAAAALAVAACGSDEKTTSGNEGQYINAGDAVYQVQLSRLMNQQDRPDDDYLRGQPALGPGQQYMAVFLTVENDGKKPYVPPRDMKVVDTQGNEYLPIDVSSTGFGLSFTDPIAPGQKVPAPNSPAQTGPVGGSLVVFRMSEDSVTQNLPLELKIPAPAGKESNIRLDL